jgi:hypothetical protein
LELSRAAWSPCTITPTNVRAEGSRSLYPASYDSAGFRADLDVSDPNTRYLNVVKRSAFLYVYAQAGEYIALGSRNRANGGDALVYNPQSFGQPGNEAWPAAADFSCATGTSQPGTHYFGGARGVIDSRAAELAGPNSADGDASVPSGFAPCAYQAPMSGIYGVRFTAATSGGSGASGSVSTPGVGNGTVSAWDVTVRANAGSLTDLNARLFSYAFVGWTGDNSRPIYTTLYYVSQGRLPLSADLARPRPERLRAVRQPLGLRRFGQSALQEHPRQYRLGHELPIERQRAARAVSHLLPATSARAARMPHSSRSSCRRSGITTDPPSATVTAGELCRQRRRQHLDGFGGRRFPFHDREQTLTRTRCVISRDARRFSTRPIR